MKHNLYIVLILILTTPLVAQELPLDSLKDNMSEIQRYLFLQQHDSAYITSYRDKLSLKLIANTKLNYFQMKDKDTEQSVLYRPNRGLNLGIGASYRWFGLEMVFSTGVEESTQLQDNRFLDFQGRVYSNKHFIETRLQYYDGYQMDDQNTSFYHRNAAHIYREDIRTVNMGLQYLFAFNYEQFSFKAPFTLTEIQRQSAGSVIGGFGFNMFSINADSTIIPPSAVDMMDPRLGYKDMLVMDLSVKLGYMHSFVYHENYFLSLGVIPGIGYSIGDYTIDSRARLDSQFTWNVKGLATLGYSAKRVFSGFQFIIDVNTIKQADKARTNMGTGKAAFFVGYRFDVD